MSERFNQLTARHRELRQRSEMQRSELGSISDDIEVRLGGVDRGVSTMRRFAHNPAVIVGALGVLALIGPRRILAYASRGALLWATARNLLRATRDDQA